MQCCTNSGHLCWAADKVPGVFTFLGIRNETLGSVHGLHTPRFMMDEAQLPLVSLIAPQLKRECRESAHHIG